METTALSQGICSGYSRKEGNRVYREYIGIIQGCYSLTPYVKQERRLGVKQETEQ